MEKHIDIFIDLLFKFGYKDKDMDIRAKEAVKAALEKAKVCKKPIARYDIETKRAYIEDAEGNRRYVE